jgi:hypothetical protein
MKKLIPFLSIGYVMYALLVAWFVGRILLQLYRGYIAEAAPVPPVQWVPFATFLLISIAFMSMFLSLAYFLWIRRRRRTVLIFAGISCLGIPIGTILGGLTIYALTRPEVSSEFAPTV